MKTKSTICCLTFFLTVLIAFARDFWEKPFTRWSRAETVKMLSDSPWAEQVVFTRQLLRLDSGISGEKELYDTYTVRFFSALPVRQAYVRMLQLTNKYDNMTAEQKTDFDGRFNKALELDTRDVIILALDFSSNDRQLAMNVRRRLEQNTAQLLKQNAYLISDRLRRVELKEYYPPAPDGTGAKFIFPRTVDGEPVVSTEDKEVKFEFYVPGPLQDGEGRPVEHKVYSVWKVKDMIYNGELAL